jgi:glycosyltransferase involved in cell wall biosynthesis
MTISVIIPTLNEEKVLASTLVHTSSLHLDEIVIVDGGSTDRTVPMARAFCERVPNAQLVLALQGRARQMNEGAKASRGEILLFLHADTKLPGTAKLDIEKAMADETVVGGRFDVDFDRGTLWSSVIGDLMNRRSRWSGFAAIPLMEDVDFSRRLKRTGRTAALRSRVVTSFRRWETNGPVRTILLMWGLRFLFWTGVDPHRLDRWYGAVR